MDEHFKFTPYREVVNYAIWHETTDKTVSQFKCSARDSDSRKCACNYLVELAGSHLQISNVHFQFVSCFHLLSRLLFDMIRV